ncbi:TetR/AcrR family transcriptional regulator [Actinocorallia lasiicapitis]
MRERLLSAALRVLTEKGPAGTTIREIAKAAGVAEGSVYTHFEGKAQLITTVFLDRMPKIELKEAISRLIGSMSDDDPSAGLRAFAVAAIDAYRELDALAGMLHGDPETAALLRAELAARRLGPGLGVQAVAAYLRLQEDRGLIVLAMDPALVTGALMGACHEYAFQSLFHEESPFGKAPEAFAAQLVAGLVRVP